MYPLGPAQFLSTPVEIGRSWKFVPQIVEEIQDAPEGDIGIYRFGNENNEHHD